MAWSFFGGLSESWLHHSVRFFVSFGECFCIIQRFFCVIQAVFVSFRKSLVSSFSDACHTHTHKTSGNQSFELVELFESVESFSVGGVLTGRIDQLG